MYWGVYVALGGGALFVLYASLSRKVRPVEGAPAAALLWMVWSLASFNVEYTDATNGMISAAYESLAFVGLAMAMASGILFVQGLRGELTEAAPDRGREPAARRGDRASAAQSQSAAAGDSRGGMGVRSPFSRDRTAADDQQPQQRS
jgi:hypothetical protein